jgi:hypothetical protein
MRPSSGTPDRVGKQSWIAISLPQSKTVNRRSIPLIAFGMCAAPLVAQSPPAWSSLGPTFPLTGSIARITAGAICHDESTSTTHLFTGGWATLTTAAAPSQRTFSTLSSSDPDSAYGSRFVFLFGGIAAASPSNELWQFDAVTSNWQLLPTAGGPTPRFDAGMAPFGIFQILFGGVDATGPRNDCWLFFPGLGWFPQPVPTNLLARRGHGMCQGPGATIVVFGGSDGFGGFLGDTWVIGNANSWTQITGPGPSPRAAKIAFDPIRGMVVLHGGVDATGALNDDWEFDGLTWRQVGATGAPLSMDSFGYSLAGPTPGIIGISQLGPAATDTLFFTPSPAAFTSTSQSSCSAATGRLALVNVNRALPILGTSLPMRVTGLTPTSLLLGGFELTSAGGPINIPLATCPQCIQGLTFSTATVTQFVSVGSGPGTGLWNLPILNIPALNGARIELQAIVVDAGAVHPCFVMTSNPASGVCGR